MKQKIKSMMLPIAIVGGALFYKWMGYLTFLSPYLIFVMLTITYCRIEPKDFKIQPFHGVMLVAQLLLSAITYFALVPFDDILATGVFICVFIPTATAAPVITGMLGGSISMLATYSLVSNLAVALLGPVILAAIGEHPEMTFQQSFSYICSLVLPLLVLPIIVAFIMRYSWKRFHDALANHQSISFYLWALALFIVVGSSVSFVIKNFTVRNLWIMLGLAFGALVVCLIQFGVGRLIGRRFGDKVSGTQGLGQKNTVLAVWLAIAYLNPIASVAPASYVAWQNILNSIQIIRHRKKQGEG
jgi:BASS family bile acid:Na+ symporter